MDIKDTFFKQFSRPSGRLGSIVGWIMALKDKRRLRWGIEKLQHSPEQAIAQEQLQLKLASVESIPFEKQSFDRVFTSNTNMFWPNPVDNLREIARVMKQQALLCLTLQPYWARDENGVRAEAGKIVTQMQIAGFEDIQVDYKTMRPITCLSVTAVKV